MKLTKTLGLTAYIAAGAKWIEQNADAVASWKSACAG